MVVASFISFLASKLPRRSREPGDAEQDTLDHSPGHRGLVVSVKDDWRNGVLEVIRLNRKGNQCRAKEDHDAQAGQTEHSHHLG
jgi:hypothetical protein